MTNRSDELEQFKTQIDLREFAASIGYSEDLRASCPSSTVMRNDSGDKIVIARDVSDDHYVYFSVRNDSDNGSIIDFVQSRGGGSLGNVRKALRPWVGTTPSLPTARRFSQKLKPVTRDIGQVRARFAAMQSVESLVNGNHPYLVEARHLPPPLLADPRFAARVFLDDRGNGVFPHFDRESSGVCGYEIKGRGFSGFATGGTKGLWASRINSNDNCLVIAEGAIDALSWAALRPIDHTRFVSTGGTLSPTQSELLIGAMEKLPQGGRVILALDNDSAGQKLADQILELHQTTDRDDLKIKTDFPPTPGADWNDMVRGGRKK